MILKIKILLMNSNILNYYKRGDYIYKQHDHISYRYELYEPLGKGSFG